MANTPNTEDREKVAMEIRQLIGGFDNAQKSVYDCVGDLYRAYVELRNAQRKP